VLTNADVRLEPDPDLRSWFKRTLAYLESIQSADFEPIPSVIFCSIKKAKATMENQAAANQAAARGGRRVGVNNWTKEETMSMLRLMDRILPIGPDEWKQVTIEHAEDYPFRNDKAALVRKYSTLHRKPIPTGNPDCPEEVKLAKRIRFKIGNRASIGDVEENFDFEKVEFGESGANPNPEPSAAVAAVAAPAVPPPAAAVPARAAPAAVAVAAPAAVAAAVPAPAVAPSSAPRKRLYGSSSRSAESAEKKDDFISLYKLNILSMQQSAEQDRQERRAQERASQQMTQQMMQMLGASLGSLATAWASGNTGASAVFRPGQQPVLEGVQEQPGVLEVDDSDDDDDSIEESPPKRLRSSRNKK
jgi:hypothetical protein